MSTVLAQLRFWIRARLVERWAALRGASWARYLGGFVNVPIGHAVSPLTDVGNRSSISELPTRDGPLDSKRDDDG